MCLQQLNNNVFQKEKKNPQIYPPSREDSFFIVGCSSLALVLFVLAKLHIVGQRCIWLNQAKIEPALG